MTALDPTRRYCMASGHAQVNCPGSGAYHIWLFKMGFGISRVPGPNDAELRAETEADHDLMADEYHGRNTRGEIIW